MSLLPRLDRQRPSHCILAARLFLYSGNTWPAKCLLPPHKCMALSEVTGWLDTLHGTGASLVTSLTAVFTAMNLMALLGVLVSLHVSAWCITLLLCLFLSV